MKKKKGKKGKEKKSASPSSRVRVTVGGRVRGRRSVRQRDHLSSIEVEPKHNNVIETKNTYSGMKQRNTEKLVYGFVRFGGILQDFVVARSRAIHRSTITSSHPAFHRASAF